MTLEDYMIAGYIGIPEFKNEPSSLKFAKQISVSCESEREHLKDMMQRYDDIEAAIRKMTLAEALIHPVDYVRGYRHWFEENKI